MREEEAEYFKDFMEHERYRIKNIRKIPYHMKVFFRYLEEGGMRIGELRHPNAQEYQTYLMTLREEDGSMHYAASTVADMVATSKNFYGYLKKKGKVYANPFKGITPIRMKEKLPRKIPREKKMAEFLEELRCFWRESRLGERRRRYKVHVIAEVMYATGLRISELGSLEERDIDFEGKVVHVREGKGGKERMAYMNEYAGRVLKIWVEEMKEVENVNKGRDKIFGVKSGWNLDRVLNRVLTEVGERSGIGRFTSHGFRHALGFHLLRRGCDMRYIQLILGHDDMHSTMLYTKVEKSDLKEEIDRYHPRQFRGGRGDEESEEFDQAVFGV